MIHPEHSAVDLPVDARLDPKWLLRTLVIAAAGLVIGGVSRRAGGMFTNGDFAPIVLLLAGAAAIVYQGNRERAQRGVQVDLATWWLMVAVGITFAFGKIATAPLLLVALFWAGSAEVSLRLAWREYVLS